MAPDHASLCRTYYVVRDCQRTVRETSAALSGRKAARQKRPIRGRGTMKRGYSLGIVLALLGSAIAPGSALGQSAADLVGTWVVVSNETVQPDGTRTQTFGPHRQGILMFD